MTRLSSMAIVVALAGLPGCFVPLPAEAAVDVSLSVGVAPPPLLVYDQPLAPAPGYLWTPGYWAWSPDGYYYWVPGTWVLPPQVGVLWTPGWWGWSDGYYRWHPGYWGPQVGFYGGINYGYGYFGSGYTGGRWHDNQFYYNTAVNRVNVTNIHNTYVDRTVIVNNNTTIKRVSYNGGRGGVMAQPTPAQRTFDRERHLAPTPVQARHVQTAMDDPAQRFQRGHALPVVAATPRGARFTGAGVERPLREPSRATPNAVAPNRGPRTQAAPQQPAQAHGSGGMPQRFQRPAEQGQMPQRPPQGGNKAPRFERPNPAQPDANAARLNEQRRATMEQTRNRAAEQARGRAEHAPSARPPEARRAPPERRPERRHERERE